MKLKSRDLAFAAIVLFVVGGLWYLSSKNKAKAMLPNPPEHLTARSREDCLQCHLPSKMAEMELQHKHPGKWSDKRVECTRCHKPPQETKVQSLNALMIRDWASRMRATN
jgi:uncharacterized paraquat-inducible protein A